MGISFGDAAIAFGGGFAKAANKEFDDIRKEKDDLKKLQIALDVERYKTKEKVYNTKKEIWDRLEPIRTGKVQGEAAFELMAGVVDPEGKQRDQLSRMFNTNTVHNYINTFNPGNAPEYAKGSELESMYSPKQHPLLRWKEDVTGEPTKASEALSVRQPKGLSTELAPMNPTGKRLQVGEWEIKGNPKDGLIRVNKTTNEWEVIREPAPDKPDKVTVPTIVKLQNERDQLDANIAGLKTSLESNAAPGSTVYDSENKKIVEAQIARMTQRRNEIDTTIAAMGKRIVWTSNEEGDQVAVAVETGGTGAPPKPVGAEKPTTNDAVVQQETRRAELAADLLGQRTVAAGREYNTNNRKGMFTPEWAHAEVVMDNPDTKEVETYPQNIDESFDVAINGRIRERLKAGEPPEKIRADLNKWTLVPDPRTKGRFGKAPTKMIWVPDTLAREPNRFKSYMDTAKKEGWTTEQIIQLFEDDGF